MIRVVVVEDEMFVRIGLKMCIGEYDPQLKVVEDFSCAEDALEYFEKNTADVLVTDIRLNGMSGLDLIRQLGKRKTHMAIIILSCYEDFSYAKEAIALGVNSYVLKHEIGEEELPKLIMEQYHLKQHSRSQDTWEYMGEVGGKEEESFGEAFMVAAFVFRREGDIQNTTSEEINFDILTEILQKHLKDEGLGECFVHRNQEVCALLRFEKKSDLNQAGERIDRFWKEAINSVQNYFNRNVYMILSKPYYDLKETKEYHAQVLEEADRIFYYEKPICLHADGDRKRTQEEVPDLKLQKENIFKDSWYQAMHHEIGLFFNRCCMAGISAKEAKFKVIKLLNEIELYLEQNYGKIAYADIFEKNQYLNYQEVENFDSSEQLQKELLKFLERVMHYMQHKKDGFDSIEQYIQEHYAEPISLADMAEKFHMNPVYFCQYFKKKKGITYVQFLNQVRVEAAKRLLREGELSSEQVSEKVGISNPNYFGRLFKKVTGMTTGEYRRLK